MRDKNRFIVPFSALSGILLRIPLKAVTALHNPGRIVRFPIGNNGWKLHGFIDDCGLAVFSDSVSAQGS